MRPHTKPLPSEWSLWTSSDHRNEDLQMERAAAVAAVVTVPISNGRDYPVKELYIRHLLIEKTSDLPWNFMGIQGSLERV